MPQVSRPKPKGLKRPVAPKGPPPVGRAVTRSAARRDARLAAAFNEWQRLYAADPASFATQFETAGQYLLDRNEGREPTYGQNCVGLLNEILAGLPAEV